MIKALILLLIATVLYGLTVYIIDSYGKKPAYIQRVVIWVSVAAIILWVLAIIFPAQILSSDGLIPICLAITLGQILTIPLAVWLLRSKISRSSKIVAALLVAVSLLLLIYIFFLSVGRSAFV